MLQGTVTKSKTSNKNIWKYITYDILLIRYWYTTSVEYVIIKKTFFSHRQLHDNVSEHLEDDPWLRILFRAPNVCRSPVSFVKHFRWLSRKGETMRYIRQVCKSHKITKNPSFDKSFIKLYKSIDAICYHHTFYEFRY